MKCEIMILLAAFLLRSMTEEVKNMNEDNHEIMERSFHPVHHRHHPDPTYKGFWHKKLVWKPRWVKTWQEKRVYVAVWKRMWGPAVHNEWVPIPKPPPGWVKPNLGLVFVKKIPH